MKEATDYTFKRLPNVNYVTNGSKVLLKKNAVQVVPSTLLNGTDPADAADDC
jgi:hypothetical protein